MQTSEISQDAPKAAPIVNTKIPPWYCWIIVIGVGCLPIGLLWDISWHISIGRDTFWTPAHILIQLGGILPALVFGWLWLEAMINNPGGQRAPAVQIWGLRAPIGAWVTVWGAVAMVTSAPFDDWWHNTYGLDVKIVSPPHSLLGVGMFAVGFGVLLFLHGWQNRRAGRGQRLTALLCVVTTGIMLTLLATFLTEYSWPNLQHAALFYQLGCATFPFYLALTARSARRPWPATTAAAVYATIMLALVWLLPLFHSQAKLAPIYNPITHMAPPAFPLLLIVPAFAIDLLAQRILPLAENPGPVKFFGREFWRAWALTFLIATAFLTLFLAVQWPVSRFLVGPGGASWVFGSHEHWPYYVRRGDWMTSFWDLDRNPLTFRGLAIAWALGCVSAGRGLALGSWLLRLKR